MLEYWYQALESKYGIVLKTDNANLALQRLYRARASSNDPDLQKLHIRKSPIDPDTLWIVQNEFGTDTDKDN